VQKNFVLLVRSRVAKLVRREEQDLQSLLNIFVAHRGDVTDEPFSMLMTVRNIHDVDCLPFESIKRHRVAVDVVRLQCTVQAPLGRSAANDAGGLLESAVGEGRYLLSPRCYAYARCKEQGFR
jgi:hypothetical protein